MIKRTGQKLNTARLSACRARVAWGAALFLFFIATFNFALAGDVPSTQPDEPLLADRVAQCISALGNPDPELRARAREALLSSGKRSDLETIRSVVQASRPLMPSQIAALKEIVQHLYLTGETYEKNATAAFMGVQLTPISVAWSPAGGVPGVLSGQAIANRFPGFCGYAALEDGDVVLEVGTHGQARLPVAGEMLATFVRSMRPGSTADLRVLRQGRLVTVPIRLDARPACLDDARFQLPAAESSMEKLLSDRQAAADRYWDTTFAPLLTRHAS